VLAWGCAHDGALGLGKVSPRALHLQRGPLHPTVGQTPLLGDSGADPLAPPWPPNSRHTEQGACVPSPRLCPSSHPTALPSQEAPTPSPLPTPILSGSKLRVVKAAAGWSHSVFLTGESWGVQAPAGGSGPSATLMCLSPTPPLSCAAPPLFPEPVILREGCITLPCPLPLCAGRRVWASPELWGQLPGSWGWGGRWPTRTPRPILFPLGLAQGGTACRSSSSSGGRYWGGEKRLRAVAVEVQDEWQETRNLAAQ